MARFSILFVIVFLMYHPQRVAGQEYQIVKDWYLSSSGDNSASCGSSQLSACRTLDWLLARFYNTSFRVNQTLSLITDTSLTVDSMLVEKHPWIMNLTVVTYLMENSDPGINLELLGVTLLGSTWTIHGLNINMEKANLAKSSLFLQPAVNQTKKGQVNILNSTFGHLKAAKQFRITVSNSNMDGKLRSGSTALDITDCDLIITKCVFHNNRAMIGPAIIKAVNSNVTVKSSLFTENIGRQEGLIHVLNGSQVIMADDAFEENKGSRAISVDNSSARIQNCIFAKNTGRFGVSIYALDHARVHVQRSIFTNNTVRFGGVIYCEDHADLDIANSSFTGNKAELGACVFAYNHTKVNLQISIFTDNMAAQGGAIYCKDQVDLHIAASRFTGNKAITKLMRKMNAATKSAMKSFRSVTKYLHHPLRYHADKTMKQGNKGIWNPLSQTGGSGHDKVVTKLQNLSSKSPKNVQHTGKIFSTVTKMVNVSLKSEHNTNTNIDGIGGAIEVTDLSTVKILDSTFTENTASDDGGAADITDSSAHIQGCLFTSNSAWKGGAIVFGDQTNGDIYDSTFSKNRAYFGGAVYVYGYGQCNVNMNKTNFTENVGTRGGALNVQHYASLYLFGSNFERNRAHQGGGSISSMTYTHLTVTSSNFKEENAGKYAAVFSLENYVNLTGHHNLFESNKAGLGGVVSVDHNVCVNITDSTFYNNTADTGAIIWATQQSVISVDRTNITGNKGSAQLYISYRCKLYIYNSNITDTRGIGGIIQASKSNVTVSNCFYARNPLPQHVVAVDGSVFHITESHFVNNSGDSHGIFYFQSNSFLFMENCIFKKNYANGQGAILYSKAANIQWKGCSAENNYATHDGGVMMVQNANVEVTDCTFTNNTSGTSGGVFHVSSQTNENYLQIEMSLFRWNNAIQGDTVADLSSMQDVNVQSSRFFHNDSEGTSIMAFSDVGTFRISNSRIHCAGAVGCRLSFQTSTLNVTNLLTHKSNFSNENTTLESDSKYFIKHAEAAGFITLYGSSYVVGSETPYASLIPLQCHNSGYACYCHYNQETGRANIYNCSSTPLSTLPSSVYNKSDWLVVENTNVATLCGSFLYMDTIWVLNLEGNYISSICDKFIDKILPNKKLMRLNLANNELTSVPKRMKDLKHLQEIRLAGNPFHCDCSMTWMIGWLNNFTKASGEHVIVDYKDLVCHTGMMVGKSIYGLNAVEMGCFPSKWTLEQKLGVGIGSGVSLIIISGLIVWIFKRSREFKFLMYYYLKLDTVPKDDKDEKVEDMKYDAFFCYSHKDFKWISDVFWKNDSREFDMEIEHGFRLLIHDRDWIAGRTIRANIMDGIEKSRRVIFIMSRNFLKSKWGMEEFMIADCEAVNGRKNFIIIVLIEKLEDHELTNELKTYMRTYTYIDATKNKDHVPKRVRYSMPHTPLRKLKPGGVTEPFKAFNFDDLSSDDEVPVQNEHRQARQEAAAENVDKEPEDSDAGDEEAQLLPNQTAVQVHNKYGAIN